MERGQVVEFRHQGVRRLAILDRPDGKKCWVAIDPQGRNHTLYPRDVTYTVGPLGLDVDELSGFYSRCQALCDGADLEVAWELLSGEVVTPPILADLVFSESTPLHQYAAHLLLSEDKLYFKQKGDAYEARPAAQVAELKHQLARQTQRQQELAGFQKRLHQALAHQPVTWEGSDRPRLEALEQFATVGEQAPRAQAAAEVLTQAGRPPTPEAAHLLLIDLGLWSPHENLALRRSQVPVTFPPRVMDVALACLHTPPPDPDAQHRLDLTGLKVYTIDDASTREIDDGLSLEDLGNGQQRLWIHIADPGRWLTPGDVLDQEARRRSTSLYLPTGTIPMFPEVLATGPMSLAQGQDCPALSFGVVLDETGAIASYELYASRVRPTYRITYDDVDELLQLGVTAEAELLGLQRWAERRLTWRLQQGAIQIQMPETSIKVLDDEVTIQVLPNSAARQLVAEMMILAGQVAADYAQSHDLPVPFRSQVQPELPPEEALIQLPAGPVRASALRRCMTRSEVGILPNRHASLGLEAYVQATSPIRRYTDLLAHWQIKAHLRGDDLPFTADDLQNVLMGVSAATHEAGAVERQTNRYWVLEYLRRQPETLWSALVLRWLRETELLALVLLEDLGVELAIRLGRPVPLGERLTVRVVHADPRLDQIHLQECSESAAEV